MWWRDDPRAAPLRAHDEALESLAPIQAHQVTTDQWGNVTLDVTLDRDDHQAALNDLFVLAQQFGYDLLNGEISKLVDSAVGRPDTRLSA